MKWRKGEMDDGGETLEETNEHVPCSSTSTSTSTSTSRERERETIERDWEDRRGNRGGNGVNAGDAPSVL